MGIRKGAVMKKRAGIIRISRCLTVLLLTVCLVTGLAGFGDGAYAATSTGSPFANTKASYQHNARFDGNLIVHGVDVSYFQSTTSDWAKAKLNGCDYAIMRVTYTTYGNGSLNVDSKFSTHFKKAKAAGVMKGVYVFSQATSVTEARKEAQYAVNRLKALGIGPKDLELPVYMDYEFAGKSSGKNKGRLYGIKKATAIKCVNAFADVIRANGYDPGVYANTNFFKSYLGNGTTLATDIDMWCAQYYSKNQSPSNYTKWQYSSTARVNGILYYSTNKIGSTDVDFWYLNKRVSSNALTKIYGTTTLKYTGKPVIPSLKVYIGSTQLKEGTDFIVGGINNVKKSTAGAYAYVKGIGKYGGYALVPITISSEDADIKKAEAAKTTAISNAANYIVKADRSKVTVPTTASTLLNKVVSTVTGKTTSGDLVVDGKGGKATVKELQKFLKVKQTGKITIKKSLRKYSKSVKSVKNGKSDATVKAMQKWLGIKADGVWGKGTTKALQKKLGIKADGYFGTASMKALQRYLNSH